MAKKTASEEYWTQTYNIGSKITAVNVLLIKFILKNPGKDIL
jgi:hypothetical protein